MKDLKNLNYGNRYLSWILRGFLFLVALFFLMFSFDVFSMDGTFVQKIGAFFMHNIFTLVLLLILGVSFKREHLAGLCLLAMSIGMIFFFGPTGIRGGTWMMISLPAIVGVLFLSNYYLIKSNTKA
jgi:hypothetical protein